MHPFALLLILVAAGAATVHSQPAAGTPAARFWEEALPGTPMPEAIADLVQEGIDHSALLEHYSVPYYSPSAFLNRYDSTRVSTSPSEFLNRYDSTKVSTSPSEFLNRYKVSTSPSEFLNRYKVSTSPSEFLNRYKVSTSGSEFLNRYTSASEFLNRYTSANGLGKAAVPPGLFFNNAQVRVGITMTVFFPPAVVPGILPRNIAEKAPFSNLSEVLATFNITAGSAEAAKVGDTLSGCMAPPLASEQKACSTSLEGTVQSAMSMLGTTRQVWAAASALPRSGLPLQQCVVQAVSPLDGERHVGCHDVPYPYAVYQCHMTGRPTKAYMMSLRGLRGGPVVAMAALCHLDTSNWSPGHPAFEILHTQPGGAPVCHFMPYANLVFGEKVATP